MRSFILILVVFCASCSGDGSRFSQLPGFAEYFATVPPGVPTGDERALLERYKPNHYLAKGQTRPMDFYDDYIANGTLHYCSGEPISSQVTADLLNRHKDDPQVCFDYADPQLPIRDSYPLYARVDYGRINGKRLTFLSYNLVFAHSGIIKGLSWYKAAALWLVGSLHDWHQLDNYIMACVVLNTNMQPVALILQQHNYTTTYLPGVHLPQQDFWQVDIALRSNELYPHNARAARHRSVSFIDTKGLAYLQGTGKPSLLSGYDHTRGEERLTTHLKFLPREDAFYRFVGRLGDKRMLPGRSAPPGAEFNTLPAFKYLPVTMVTSYRRPGRDTEYQSIFADMFQGFDSRPSRQQLQQLTERLVEDLQAQGMDL